MQWQTVSSQSVNDVMLKAATPIGAEWKAPVTRREVRLKNVRPIDHSLAACAC